MAFYIIQWSRNLYCSVLSASLIEVQKDCEGENLFVINGGSAIDSRITEYKHISIVAFIEAYFSDKATIILNIFHNRFITPKLFILTMLQERNFSCSMQWLSLGVFFWEKYLDHNYTLVQYNLSYLIKFSALCHIFTFLVHEESQT